MPAFSKELRSEDDNEKKLDQLRANLLNLINEERAVEKVPPVALDDLATRVATRHAEDMAKHQYMNHWDRDGLKPYQRYSLAGGTHATQENISAADNTWSTKLNDLLQDTSYLHVRLYQEKPPNDGHRRAILAPQHTHVGLGIGIEKLRLRVVELFVAKYVDVGRVPQKASPDDSFRFTGELIKSGHSLHTIEVFYEPLPKEPDLDWLRHSRLSYSLPNESVILRPMLRPPLLYADKRPGVVEVAPDGSFAAPIRLFKNQPGIYTLVAWVRNRTGKPFPATEVCVRAE